MDFESEQEFFEVYLATISNSAYPKAIFSIDDFGRQKTLPEINWEISIAEEQGFTPVIAMWANKMPYFILFSPHTGMTGYFTRSDSSV